MPPFLNLHPPFCTRTVKAPARNPQKEFLGPHKRATLLGEVKKRVYSRNPVFYKMDYSCSLKTRDIKDSIHGNIKVYPALAQFIDTYQFQRLRNIKQLGTTSYVWPTATHTRFEHSLGVAYLARKMVTHLQRMQPELCISDREVACVEIAGLCHDLGHGPWSHVWDNRFIPSVLGDIKWTHEQGSEMMFDYLVQDNEIPMPQQDQNFIKALISGEHVRVPNEKGFLFDIIANKRNGLDVDKFDYLWRDGHMSGRPITLEIDRLMESARVLDDQICYNMKDISLVFTFFQARFNMHNQVYNHKTTKAIEYMIVDALSAADSHLNIARRVFNPEEYVHLSDHIMTEIESSKAPELAKSRDILKRIHRRKIYRHVDFKMVEWPLRQVFRDNVTPARIMDAIKNILANKQDVSKDQVECPLEESDIIVDISTRSHGMQEKNPVDSVRFYSKRNPNQSLNADRGVITSVLPQYFAEDAVNIFTKEENYVALVQAGYRAILAKLAQETEFDWSESPEFLVHLSQDTQAASTPPDTDIEVPSTPKALSRKSSQIINPGDGMSKSYGTTPFANNEFTTLPGPTLVIPGSPSPSQGGTKRNREDDTDNFPNKKRT